jgi:thiol-disulfide isomerase/thioredoxin
MRTVVCLCADWCGVCREYRPLFDRFAQARPDLRFEWVDIEDEADLMGDVDVETFPTLLVADDAKVRFFGPVLPREEALSAALRSADAGSMVSDEEVAALARRLQERG